MPEPLLHFIIPFVALIICGLGTKKSILLASFAILPDLDILFHIHRSFTHSIPILLLFCFPIVIVIRLKYFEWFHDSLIATLVLMSHPFLDAFHTYTPVLYPIYNKSIYIVVMLTTNLYHFTQIDFLFEIRRTSVLFPVLTENCIDGTIISSLGFAITLIFLLGIVYISRYKNDNKNCSDQSRKR